MKTPADIQVELQAAIDAENADTSTHAAAITQAISDLAALATTSDPIVSLTGTTQSGATVSFVPA